MTSHSYLVAKLHGTTDARVWAQEFMKVVEGGATVDEGLMIGWFANAMVVAHSHGHQDGMAQASAVLGVESLR